MYLFFLLMLRLSLSGIIKFSTIYVSYFVTLSRDFGYPYEQISPDVSSFLLSYMSIQVDLQNLRYLPDLWVVRSKSLWRRLFLG